jgi:hypothetical protein
MTVSLTPPPGATPERAAAFWPARTVRLAVHALPPGPIRERYQQEILAELYGLDRFRQTRHALRVLTHSHALRSALTPRHFSSTEPVMHTATPRRPLLCRTHVHHKWRLERNPEGETYLRCGRCGNDRYDVERVDGPNMGGNLMGLHGGV